MVILGKPAVFFDRDGVLNVDYGYVYKQDEFKWIPGAVETIRALKEYGYTIIVVTNQSGIARGYYTEIEVKKLHNWMNYQLLTKHNIQIDAFFYCPHHPSIGNNPFKMICECRKPMPGLIKRAINDFNIDTDRSYLIGDKDTDLEAAKAIGIKGYKFTSNNLFEFVMEKNLL